MGVQGGMGAQEGAGARRRGATGAEAGIKHLGGVFEDGLWTNGRHAESPHSEE